MIPLPELPKIIQKENNKAIFEISPLYPNYGITIGNSLRRVLLSSLEGAAITEVKIEGVSHEFSTLPGVLEDILIILLNLKKIRLKLFTDEPQVLTLEVKGEKKIQAKDFKLNPQIEIVNPETHIATLTDKKASLILEAKVEKGIGYSPAEEREKKELEVEALFLDAIFTPVRKVNFIIENVIVGKRTDFEKLKVEIETDGTVSPEETFVRAANILIEHFSLFIKLELPKLEIKKRKKAEKKEKSGKTKKSKKPKETKKLKETKKKVKSQK